jgi:hypothetical protein
MSGVLSYGRAREKVMAAKNALLDSLASQNDAPNLVDRSPRLNRICLRSGTPPATVMHGLKTLARTVTPESGGNAENVIMNGRQGRELRLVDHVQ